MNVQEEIEKLNALILTEEESNFTLAFQLAKSAGISQEFEEFLHKHYIGFSELIVGKKSKTLITALKLMFQKLNEKASFSRFPYTSDSFKQTASWKLGTNRISCIFDPSLSDNRLEQIVNIHFHKFGVKDHGPCSC